MTCYAKLKSLIFSQTTPIWSGFDSAYGVAVCILMGIIILLTFYISNKAKRKVRDTETGYTLFTYGFAVVGSYFGLWIVMGLPGLASISSAGFANYIAIYGGLFAALFLFPSIYGKVIKIAERYRVNSLFSFISRRYGDIGAFHIILTVISFIIMLPIIAYPIHLISDLIRLFSGDNISLLLSYLITSLMVFFLVNRLNPRNLRSIGSFNFLMAVFFGFVLFLIAIFTGEHSEMTTQIVRPHGSVFISLFIIGFLSMFTLPRQFTVIRSNLKTNPLTYLKVIIVCFGIFIPVFHLLSPYIGWGGYLFTIKTGKHFNLKAFAVLAIMFGCAFSTIGPQLNSYTRIIHEGLFSKFFVKTKKALKWSFISSLMFLLVAVLIFGLFSGFFVKGFQGSIPSEFEQIKSSYVLSHLFFASLMFLSVFAILLLGGLYWKKGNRYGATIGLLSGAATWFIVAFLPMFSKINLLEKMLKIKFGQGYFYLIALALIIGVTAVTYTLFSLITKKDPISLVEGYVAIDEAGVEFFISEDIQRFMLETAKTPLKMELIAYFKDNLNNQYTLRDLMIRLFWKGEFHEDEVEENLKELVELGFVKEFDRKGEHYYEYKFSDQETDDIIENFTRSYYTAKQIFYKQAEEEFNRQSEKLRKEKQKLSNEVDQLEVFMEVSGALSKILDLELLYKKVAELATKNIGFDSSEIYLLNNDGSISLKQIFYSNYTHLTQSEEHFNDLFKSDEQKQTLIKQIIDSGEPFIMNEPSEAGTEDKAVYVIHPVREEGKIVALIEVGYASKAKRISENDLNKLKIFLNTVELAFASVRLFENLEEKVRQRTAQLNKANEEMKDLNSKLETANKEMKRELKVASMIQQAIVPKQMPKEPAMKIGYFWVPMTEVSGDYFDVIEVGKGKYGILIADVSGHGVPSALITTMAKISFINHSKPGMTTAEICAIVNKEIYAALGDIGFYLTAFYAIFDVNTKELLFTNAGHQMSYWYQKNLNQIVELDSAGFFIGSFDEAEYGYNSVILEPGDKVVFFTDGIVEARNPDGEFFEEDRLREFVINSKDDSASKMANNLIGMVEDFAQGRPANDDRTAIILEVTGKGISKTTQEGKEQVKKDRIVAEFMKLFNEGVKASKEEKFDEAIKYFEKAIKISPKSAQIYINLGHIYRKMKDYDKALNMFHEALKIKDDLVEAHNSLGVVYFFKKDLNKAVEHFEITLKLNPELKSAKENLNKIKKLLDNQK